MRKQTKKKAKDLEDIRLLKQSKPFIKKVNYIILQ